MGHEVVVGVEGTLSSRRAVHWAAEAAWARRTELLLVHAVGKPAPGQEAAWSRAVDGGVHEMLRREADRVRRAEPGLTVRAEVDLDTPARALTQRSRTAQLVVVGTRRTTAAQRVFSGSLSYQVAAGASCSVAVVPPLTGHAENRVVVGLDHSPDAQAAVRAGAREADRVGARLELLHAWQPPGEAGDRALVDGAADDLADDFPGLAVDRRLVQSHPAIALLTAAAGARLLVVGSRGTDGVPRIPLGATSHALVLHAPCPVLVVRT